MNSELGQVRKRSNSELMEEDPCRWIGTRLKYLMIELNPSKQEIQIPLDLPISFVPMDSLKLDEITLNEERVLRDVIDQYTYFRDGDILQAKVSPCFENKNLAIATGLLNGIGFGTTEIYVIRTRAGVSNRFLFYRLQESSFMAFAAASMTGVAGLKRIPSDVLTDYVIGTPDLREQHAIAAFLDHETARIDALIAEQQRLIGLLQEKRQAVITQAVTKGLDPNVPMQDSGVTWLGEVPKSWGVIPLKYQCTFQGGGTPAKDDADNWEGDIPWVSAKDMKTFWLSDSQDKITRKALLNSSTHLIETGALLMVVRSGILKRTIPVAMNTVPMAINQDMKALRFASSDQAEFAVYLIRAMEAPLLLEWRKQGATVESLEHEYLANTPFPLVPEAELPPILSYIREQEQRCSRLQAEASQAIELLKERRAALISAAVTGQIDVHNWQATGSRIGPGFTMELPHG